MLEVHKLAKRNRGETPIQSIEDSSDRGRKCDRNSETKEKALPKKGNQPLLDPGGVISDSIKSSPIIAIVRSLQRGCLCRQARLQFSYDHYPPFSEHAYSQCWSSTIDKSKDTLQLIQIARLLSSRPKLVFDRLGLIGRSTRLSASGPPHRRCAVVEHLAHSLACGVALWVRVHITVTRRTVGWRGHMSRRLPANATHVRAANCAAWSLLVLDAGLECLRWSIACWMRGGPHAVGIPSRRRGGWAADVDISPEVDWE